MRGGRWISFALRMVAYRSIYVALSGFSMIIIMAD